MYSLLSAQEKEDYRMGTLWLKNSQSLEGFIWSAAGMSDRLDYLFFKPELNDLADKYYADDISQFEIWQGSRRFYSILLPIGSGKVRKIAELHFKGDYSLYSAFEGLDRVFFLADTSGNISRLENTVAGGSEAEPGVNFNNEYKKSLTEILNDLPGVSGKMENVRYHRKDLSKLLEEYHNVRNLSFVSYPIPRADWYISAGGTAGLFSHMTRINGMTDNFVSPLTAVNLSLDIVAHQRRAFSRINFSRFSGHLYRDFSLDNIATNTISFFEERTSVSLFDVNCLLGFNLNARGRFLPYVAAGAGYTVYLNYSNQVMTETQYLDYGIIITDLNQFVTVPDNYPAVIAEAGANYILAPGRYIRAGASYGRIFDKSEIMKSRFNLTFTYVYKLF